MDWSEWNEETEAELVRLREVEGHSFSYIEMISGRTQASLKHKYNRIKQKENSDEKHHPVEKTEQYNRVIGQLDWKIIYRVLETNGGWGNMTQIYNKIGMIETFDIKQDRVDFLNTLDRVTATKHDSVHYLHKLVYQNKKYDIIDIDPYGMPSRYFPHVFGLIDDGLMFITIPKVGVAQINRITKQHWLAFWGVDVSDTSNVLEKVIKKLEDYAFYYMLRVELLDVIEIGKVWRIAIKVNKESAMTLADK